MSQRMYEELLELIQTDAYSGKEREVAEKLKKKLEALGFSVREDQAGESFGGECGNLIAVLPGELPGSLLFSSHMDRVPNGFGIQPVERNGVLYSDGSTILAADDISGVCAILEGMRQIKETGEAHPRIEIVFSVGEETGLHGAKALDFTALQSKLGFIFDSPGPVGRFVNAAPGHVMIEGRVSGRPAHAGNEPEKGIDAARILCEMLASMRIGRLDEVTTSNFPILSTGAKGTNVVCDQASFRGEARSRELSKLKEYTEYVEAHCRKIAEERGAGFELTVSPTFLPFSIPETEPVLKLAKEVSDKLGLSMLVERGGGGMDANIYNEKGISCIGVATGYTKNHTKEEQLVLSDFYRSGELCAELVRAYSAGVEKA